MNYNCNDFHVVRIPTVKSSHINELSPFIHNNLIDNLACRTLMYTRVEGCVVEILFEELSASSKGEAKSQ